MIFGREKKGTTKCCTVKTRDCVSSIPWCLCFTIGFNGRNDQRERSIFVRLVQFAIVGKLAQHNLNGTDLVYRQGLSLVNRNTSSTDDRDQVFERNVQILPDAWFGVHHDAPGRTVPLLGIAQDDLVGVPIGLDTELDPFVPGQVQRRRQIPVLFNV